MLILNKNKIPLITKEYMNNYKKLVKFAYNCRDINFRPKIDADAFSTLPHLTHLDIGENLIGGDTKLIFPPTLNSLYYHLANLTSPNLNVSFLKYLKRLDVSLNELTEFPEIYDKAPLEWVSISVNYILYVPPEVFARYCALEYFDYLMISNSPVFRDYCLCKKYFDWVSEHPIPGLVPLTHDCQPVNPKCPNAGVTDQMQKENAECMKRMKKNKRFLKYVLPFIILTIIITIIIYTVYRYSKKKPQAFLSPPPKASAKEATDENTGEVSEEDLG